MILLLWWIGVPLGLALLYLLILAPVLCWFYLREQELGKKRYYYTDRGYQDTYQNDWKFLSDYFFIWNRMQAYLVLKIQRLAKLYPPKPYR